MAAGSVMNEPRTGPMVRIATHHAAGVRAADSGDTPQGRLGESDDRPRRCEGHDHHDEQGFRVADGLTDVVSGRLPSGVHRGRDEEDHGPQAEYHLDFSEEMENLRAHTRRRRSAVLRVPAHRDGAASGVRDERRVPPQTCGESPRKTHLWRWH